MQLLVLLHGRGSSSGVLHGVRYKLIAEELVHLLEGLAFGLGEEEPVAGERNDVKDKEDVEVFELDRAQRLRTKLCEYEVNKPVHKGCDGVTECADFHRKNLDNGSVARRLPTMVPSLTSAGYTQEMIPSGV